MYDIGGEDKGNTHKNKVTNKWGCIYKNHTNVEQHWMMVKWSQVGQTMGWRKVVHV